MLVLPAREEETVERGEHLEITIFEKCFCERLSLQLPCTKYTLLSRLTNPIKYQQRPVFFFFRDSLQPMGKPWRQKSCGKRRSVSIQAESI
jgi:hypothetical protein